MIQVSMEEHRLWFNETKEAIMNLRIQIGEIFESWWSNLDVGNICILGLPVKEQEMLLA